MLSNDAEAPAATHSAATRSSARGAGAELESDSELARWAAPGVDLPASNASPFDIHVLEPGSSSAFANVAEAHLLDTSAADDPISTFDPLSVLHAGQVGTLPDTALILLTRQAEHLGREIDAIRVKLAGEIDARSKIDSGDGTLTTRYECRNSIELIQRLTQVSSKVASRRCRIARATRGNVGITGHRVPPQFPAIAAALDAHTIGLDAAEHIVYALSGLPTAVGHADIDYAERCLVAAALGTAAPEDSPGGHTPNTDECSTLPLHADDVRVVAKAFRAALDQDGPEPSYEEASKCRAFRLGAEKNGLVPLYGALLPEVAALFGRMIDAINSPRTAANEMAPGVGATGRVQFVETLLDAPCGAEDSAAPDDSADSAPLVPRDARTPDQKRHDAVAAIAQAAAAHASMPVLGGAPVTVMIQVAQETLEAGRGTAWLHGHDGELSPLPVTAATHSSCAGTIQRITQDHTGRIIELGTRDRIFNAHQRRAIAARDGGCVIPGCSTPATWCEIHHVTEYSQGGKTETDNGVALCWHHHRTLDRSGWRVRMRAGLPEVLAPAWIDHTAKWRPARSPLGAPNLTRLRR